MLGLIIVIVSLFTLAGVAGWLVFRDPPGSTVIFAIYQDGLLVAATARPAHAEAMVRLGHEVRRVTFDRESTEKLESEP